MLTATFNYLSRNKRLLIIALFIAALSVNFWSGSRVPSLNDKASLGGDLILEDPLGFEAAYPIDQSDPVLTKIFFTSVNWVSTNRQGMTFGLLFAAAFMTLLSLLKRRSFNSGFGNTLLGLFIGAPLGVCVNCAAPIARGMHASGTRLETTLVTMIASPTLNIIVLTMLFNLLPFYMAAIKLGLTLAFLLILVPLLTRYVFRDVVVADSVAENPAMLFQGVSDAPDAVCALPDVEPNLIESLRWLFVDYLKNLWYIVKLTVPLMLLSGFLGAVAITVFPWNDITALFQGDSGLFAVLGLLAVCGVGLFLPVPIAFDVAIVAALLAGGMPELYCMVLLFTLGIFSVFSFSIVWTGISKKVAVVLTGVLFLMGLVSGGMASAYAAWDEERQLSIFEENYLHPQHPATEEAAPEPAETSGAKASDPAQSSSPAALNAQSPEAGSGADITVSELDLASSSSAPGPLFTRFYGSEFGLERNPDMSVSWKFITPFYRDWPISSADFDGDGWIDIIVGTDKGFTLYRNEQGKRFVPQDIDIPQLKGMDASNAVLIDLNNDRQVDIYISSYGNGQHIIYNDNGKFESKNYLALPKMSSMLANATAFGDLDVDGDIDIVLGNWTAGRWSRRSPESSRNAILWNDNGEYRVEYMEGLPGETLSILISDINQDGYPDIMVGNDFEQPDFFYYGQKGGTRRLVTKADNQFPQTSFSTMSIDSGDFDNDLTLEIYESQASGFTSTNPTNRANMLPLQSVERTCEEYNDNEEWKNRCITRIGQHKLIAKARRKREPSICLKIDDPVEKEQCLGYIFLEKVTVAKQRPELCDKFPPQHSVFANICRISHGPRAVYPEDEVQASLKQIFGRNIFYYIEKDGSYSDIAEQVDTDISGWSWTAKFADINNDEWQDIYVVNGHYRSAKRATNVFFENQSGTRFQNSTREAGLENYLAMSSYTYNDFDNDGDLDIIAVSFDGPIWVYRNNTVDRHSVFFELDDKTGNRYGVGSRLVIHYGEKDSKHQLRELKASGGFLSYDAPMLHFGLGEHQQVNRVEVFWSTGGHDVLEGPFYSGKRYKLEKAPAAG